MIPSRRRPTHPGTLLRALYLEPQNVSIRSLSEATGVSRKHLSRIVNGHARISAQVAMKLAAVLETTPELWINAQRNVDLYDARQGLKDWQPQKVLSARRDS